MPPTTSSDSEDDLDYVPPADDHSSDSDEDQAQLEPIEAAPPPPDPASQKKQRDALWASFRASVATPPPNANGALTSTPHSQPQPPTVKRVQIEKTYLFAGKHVTEVVEVPEDSEDAKRWPRWSARPQPTSDGLDVSVKEGKRVAKDEGEDDNSTSSSSPPVVDSSPAPPVTTVAATSTPGVRRPGPRKPRMTLPSIPKASQAKKITTIDKSAMDWRAHVATQSNNVKDELDVNRRGGGYLEKVDFLKRVQDRREEAFEASKSNKRRKT